MRLCCGAKAIIGAMLPSGVVGNHDINITVQGLVRYCLKAPYRDGTTYVILDHEKSKQETLGFGSTVLARGPPQESLFD